MSLNGRYRDSCDRDTASIYDVGFSPLNTGSWTRAEV